MNFMISILALFGLELHCSMHLLKVIVSFGKKCIQNKWPIRSKYMVDSTDPYPSILLYNRIVYTDMVRREGGARRLPPFPPTAKTHISKDQAVWCLLCGRRCRRLLSIHGSLNSSREAEPGREGLDLRGLHSLLTDAVWYLWLGSYLCR